ncbi:hypothetical protein HK405_007660, partial [Cladochytrium tenue]
MIAASTATATSEPPPYQFDAAVTGATPLDGRGLDAGYYPADSVGASDGVGVDDDASWIAPPPQAEEDHLPGTVPFMNEALLNALLYIGLPGGQIVALEKRGGAIAWRTTVPTRAIRPGVKSLTAIHPHPSSESLVVTAGPTVASISAVDGSIRWSQSLPALLPGAPSGAQAAAALEPDSTLARQLTGISPVEQPLPPAAAAAARLVFAASNNAVTAIDVWSGATVWRFKTSPLAGCSTIPALLVEDSLLFLAGNGRVWALDAVSGVQVWMVDTQPSNRSYSTLATMRSSPLCRPIHFDPCAPAAVLAPRTHTVYLTTGGFVTPYESVTGNPVLNPTPILIIPGEFDLRVAIGSGNTTMLPLPASFSALATSGHTVGRVNLSNGRVTWTNRPTTAAPKSAHATVVSLVAGGAAVSPHRLWAAVTFRKSDAALADRVFVRYSQNVVALKVVDGSPVWTTLLPDDRVLPVYSIPRILADVDGRVFTADYRSMRCLFSSNGHI